MVGHGQRRRGNRRWQDRGGKQRRSAPVSARRSHVSGASSQVKVAFNALAAVTGGAITHLGPFLAALRKVRPHWELMVFTANEAGTRATAGVEAFELQLPRRWSRAVWEFHGVDRRAAAAGADCVVNLLNSGALRPRLPTITWQRNALYFDRSWLARQPRTAQLDARVRRIAALLCCRASDAVVVPSRAMATLLMSWRMARGMRVHVVPHAVETSKFHFRPRELERRPLVMGVMGGPAAHRGLDTAVEVLATLRSLGVDVRLRLTVNRHGNPAGQELIDSVARATQRAGVSDHLDLTGEVRSSTEWYDEIDILLVPSRCESFGFPLVEALASGLPVIASALPALMELADDAVQFVTPDDPSSFVAAILDLTDASPDDLLARLRRGLKSVERLTWDVAAEATACLIEDVVRQRP